MLKDELGIVIITYNRAKYMKDTLEALFAENSPVRDCEITILNNNSTDRTSEVIDEFCGKYPNLRHVVNRINIGGNPNVAKAYIEFSTKKYIWLLCDNDKYNWKNFSEIERAVTEDYDVIFTQKCSGDIAEVFYKSAFAPACIYKTENITPTVVENMYGNIRNLFPHLALISYNINKDNRIYYPSDDTVIQVINPEDNRIIFNRGYEEEYLPEDRKNILWLTGYVNSMELIVDRQKRTRIIEGCRHHHRSLYELFRTFFIQNKYDRKSYGRNFTQVFGKLNFTQRLRFLLAFLSVNLSFKNYKFYEIRTYDDWSEYFSEVAEQKYIDKLSQKLRGKKVLLYGAGIVSEVLTDGYDLSGLDIIGIADKRFEIFGGEEFKGYKAVKPSEIGQYGFDYILFTMKLYKKIMKDLRKSGINSHADTLVKNDGKYVLRVG